MSLADSLLYEGTIEPGTVQISAPDQPVIMEIRGSYNWIHLHVGNDFLAKCQSMLRAGARGAPSPADSEPLFHDIVIYDLVRALVTMSESSTTTAPFGVESIVLAIVLRILGRNARSYDASAPRAKALISWRLKRVKEHVAAHLAGPITLPDLAQAAGLTRMHFAAQFKAATGLRPREYVLQHRIARARKLLLESDLKLVDIALASGFQTQAHFTTVFKKLTYSTPYEWRCRERDRNVTRSGPPPQE
jgi:AraC-like DNA-binding protein